DTRYIDQWHYQGGASGMNLPAAWDLSTGAGVVVAVIDTGVTSHPDLNGNVIGGYDFITDPARARDGDGRDANPADEGDWTVAGECSATWTARNSSWHGTHVSGTVAAVTGNAAGVAGVAFNARVQPVRVMGRCGGLVSDIVDGIVWASGGAIAGAPANATPAKVINMSLGGSGTCDAAYQTAIDAAVARGSVVVVAAGNSNADASGHRPANCNNVVTVASLDREGNRAAYSNYGTRIDLAAPGGETSPTAANGVLSTLNFGTTTPYPTTSGYFARLQGTSMAAPHVSGLAALMLSRNPALTPAQIESLLKANVRAITGACSGGCGAGAADALKAVTAAGSGGGNTPPVANFSFTSSGLSATFTDTSTDAGGSIASRSWNFGDGTTSTLANPSKTYAAAGAYTVTLTVTDNGGLNNSVSKTVTVSSANTPPVANFNFTTSGLSATFTDTSTDAGGSIASRSWNFGDGTTSTLANPSKTYAAAGAYNVALTVTDNGGLTHTVTKSVTVSSGGGGPFFQNLTDYPINDNATVDSPITVTGVAGNAPATLSVSVRIIHTYQGDLRVDLVAPDGSLYNLHNRSGGSVDNMIKTVTVNASTEVANGVWKLRVNDNVGGDTGYIDSWSMQF
ncbi:MAG: PKD domain-containing protein, partial [Lysobacteraceae bacterium]